MPSIRIRAATSSTPALNIEYRTFGDPSHTPMLLVMGLGGCILNWPWKTFCEPIAAAGFYVIIWDNRDSGRSTFFDHLGKPRLEAHFIASLVPGGGALAPALGMTPPYSLLEVAEDGILLLDALCGKHAKGHLAGASMGGS